MGLPPGWVTDVPALTRNQQLTLLGNGVIPAHGAAALTTLLNRPDHFDRLDRLDHGRGAA